MQLDRNLIIIIVGHECILINVCVQSCLLKNLWRAANLLEIPGLAKYVQNIAIDDELLNVELLKNLKSVSISSQFVASKDLERSDM